MVKESQIIAYAEEYKQIFHRLENANKSLVLLCQEYGLTNPSIDNFKLELLAQERFNSKILTEKLKELYEFQ